MDDGPSYQDIINRLGDLINHVDASSKRDADKLGDDMSTLRTELNNTRSDIASMRGEMNTLRSEMKEMKGELTTCGTQIQLMKQRAEIEGSRRNKIVGGFIALASILGIALAKFYDIIKV